MQTRRTAFTISSNAFHEAAQCLVLLLYVPLVSRICLAIWHPTLRYPYQTYSARNVMEYLPPPAVNNPRESPPAASRRPGLSEAREPALSLRFGGAIYETKARCCHFRSCNTGACSRAAKRTEANKGGCSKCRPDNHQR